MKLTCQGGAGVVMRGAESAPILFFIDQAARTDLVTYRIGARRLLSLLNQLQLIPSINQALVIAGSARDRGPFES